MTTNDLAFYIGGCPECGNVDGCDWVVDQDVGHPWAHCQQHRKKWIPLDWVPGDESMQEAIAEREAKERVKDYQEVEPLRLERQICDICGEREPEHHQLCKHGTYGEAPLSETARKEVVAWMRLNDLWIGDKSWLF
jgi:hypothetical protein